MVGVGTEKMVLTSLTPPQIRTEKEILEQLERNKLFIDRSFPREDNANDFFYVCGEIAALEWVLSTLKKL